MLGKLAVAGIAAALAGRELCRKAAKGHLRQRLKRRMGLRRRRAARVPGVPM